MMAAPMAGSNGSDQNGRMTRNVQTIKKTIGRIKLTLIGRGRSGCLILNHNKAATDMVTNNDSMKAA